MADVVVMAMATVFKETPGIAILLNLNFGEGFHLCLSTGLGKDRCPHTSVYVTACYHNLKKALALDVEVTSALAVFGCLDTLSL